MGNLSSAFEKADTSAAYLNGAMNFSLSYWEFVSKLPTAVRGGAKSSKGSYRMGDGQIFLNLRAPLFNVPKK
jgi:hypothetical protein